LRGWGGGQHAAAACPNTPISNLAEPPNLPQSLRRKFFEALYQSLQELLEAAFSKVGGALQAASLLLRLLP
jgi:hypothetical protein